MGGRTLNDTKRMYLYIPSFSHIFKSNSNQFYTALMITRTGDLWSLSGILSK